MNPERRIYVVGNDEQHRAMISRLADAMREKCLLYQTAEEFLADYEPSDAGCLVSEFRLLGINGVDLQMRLAEEGSRLPVIFVTDFPSTRLVVRAMGNGAITVLEKPIHEQELWDAIRRAFARDHEVRRTDAAHADIRNRFSRLSQREWEVLKLIVDGGTNKSIAADLDVSVRTVENCRHNLFKKTRAKSVAEIVRLVLEGRLDLKNI